MNHRVPIRDKCDPTKLVNPAENNLTDLLRLALNCRECNDENQVIVSYGQN